MNTERSEKWPQFGGVGRGGAGRDGSGQETYPTAIPGGEPPLPHDAKVSDIWSKNKRRGKGRWGVAVRKPSLFIVRWGARWAGAGRGRWHFVETRCSGCIRFEAN